MRFLTITLAMVLGFNVLEANALESDRDKPATIEADEVEFDFRTGERTYKGNVIVVQGTLRVTGDRMVVQYGDNNEEIETATSWGEPATFKQRPDGKEQDVYGEGDTIIMNQVDDTLTLIENAVMTQAGNTAEGKRIVYYMSTDKMTVEGYRQGPEQAEGEEMTTDPETGRAKVIITPEETGQAGGASSAESGETTESEGAETKRAETSGTADQDDGQQTEEPLENHDKTGADTKSE